MSLLTVEQVAEYLQISESSLRRLMYKGDIPYVKVGGSVRFEPGDITQYIDKQKSLSTAGKKQKQNRYSKNKFHSTHVCEYVPGMKVV